MSGITTHILDLTTGTPGAGIAVILERKTHSAGWQRLGESFTDIDGRVTALLPAGEVFLSGHYRLIFETGAYFLLRGIEPFYPHVIVAFTVKDTAQNYHMPVLLSPFGYSTYRGS
jgi:5-hydroxyisourate hydrolase